MSWLSRGPGASDSSGIPDGLFTPQVSAVYDVPYFILAGQSDGLTTFRELARSVDTQGMNCAIDITVGSYKTCLGTGQVNRGLDGYIYALVEHSKTNQMVYVVLFDANGILRLKILALHAAMQLSYQPLPITFYPCVGDNYEVVQARVFNALPPLTTTDYCKKLKDLLPNIPLAGARTPQGYPAEESILLLDVKMADGSIGKEWWADSCKQGDHVICYVTPHSNREIIMECILFQGRRSMQLEVKHIGQRPGGS